MLIGKFLRYVTIDRGAVCMCGRTETGCVRLQQLGHGEMAAFARHVSGGFASGVLEAAIGSCSSRKRTAGSWP
jgi:hypothetical protein